MLKKTNYREFEKEVNKYFSSKTGIPSDMFCITASDYHAIYIYTKLIIEQYCNEVLFIAPKEFTKHYSVEQVTKHLFERIQPLADKYNIKYEAIMFVELQYLYGKQFYTTVYNPKVSITYIPNESSFINYAHSLD